MRTIKDRAFQLAKDLSERSIIKIKVGAVIYNKEGIVSWGWNNPGKDGRGEHAECMAVRRLVGVYPGTTSSLSIAVFSSRKGRPNNSRPCARCQEVLRSRGIKNYVYNIKLQVAEDLFEIRQVRETCK
jgi:deoxycytidylate deaminase